MSDMDPLEAAQAEIAALKAENEDLMRALLDERRASNYHREKSLFWLRQFNAVRTDKAA